MWVVRPTLPALRHRPLPILSNNDVVSRAKQGENEMSKCVMCGNDPYKCALPLTTVIKTETSEYRVCFDCFIKNGPDSVMSKIREVEGVLK